MKCIYCKGTYTDGHSTHVADLGTCIVIIRGVPCSKCEQCGEVSYTGTVVRQIENIVDVLRNAMTEIAVVNYSDKVA